MEIGAFTPLSKRVFLRVARPDRRRTWNVQRVLSDDGCATPIERSTTKGNARTEPGAKLEGRWEGVSKMPSILSIWWFRSPRRVLAHTAAHKGPEACSVG